MSRGFGGSAFTAARPRFWMSAADCVRLSCFGASDTEETGDCDDCDEYGGGDETFENDDVEVADGNGEGILPEGRLSGAGLNCDDRLSNEEGVPSAGDIRSCGSVLDLAIPTGGSGGGAYGDGNQVVHGRSGS